METLNKILKYIADRLKEPSTYPGIMLIGTALTHWGTTDAPTQQQVILEIGLFIAGLISVAMPDRLSHNSRASDQATVPPPAPTQPPAPAAKPSEGETK